MLLIEQLAEHLLDILFMARIGCSYYDVWTNIIEFIKTMVFIEESIKAGLDRLVVLVVSVLDFEAMFIEPCLEEYCWSMGSVEPGVRIGQ